MSMSKHSRIEYSRCTPKKRQEEYGGKVLRFQDLGAFLTNGQKPTKDLLPQLSLPKPWAPWLWFDDLTTWSTAEELVDWNPGHLPHFQGEALLFEPSDKDGTRLTRPFGDSNVWPSLCRNISESWEKHGKQLPATRATTWRHPLELALQEMAVCWPWWNELTIDTEHTYACDPYTRDLLCILMILSYSIFFSMKLIHSIFHYRDRTIWVHTTYFSYAE